MLKLIVTGTGRCGTGYTATVLNKAGIKTGHEQVFKVTGPIKDHDYTVDVSWLALPYLEQYAVPKLHIWRDAEPCVASLEKIGIPTGSNSYHKFAARHSGAVSARDFYNWWNNRCAEQCNWSVNIKRLELMLPSVLRLSGIELDQDLLEKAFASTPTNVNTR